MHIKSVVEILFCKNVTYYKLTESSKEVNKFCTLVSYIVVRITIIARGYFHKFSSLLTLGRTHKLSISIGINVAMVPEFQQESHYVCMSTALEHCPYCVCMCVGSFFWFTYCQGSMRVGYSLQCSAVKGFLTCATCTQVLQVLREGWTMNPVLQHQEGVPTLGLFPSHLLKHLIAFHVSIHLPLHSIFHLQQSIMSSREASMVC